MKISELPAPQLFVTLAERHGHYCPMSTLGLRLGWAAMKILNSGIQEATYFAQTCAGDGIRLVLKFDALQINEQGQHLLRVIDEDSHWQIEILPETLELAASYRLLDTDSARDRLLEKLRTADESRLLKFTDCGEII